MLFIYFEVGQHIQLALHVLLRDLDDDAGDNTLKQEKYSILSILFSNFIFISFVYIFCCLRIEDDSISPFLVYCDFCANRLSLDYLLITYYIIIITMNKHSIKFGEKHKIDVIDQYVNIFEESLYNLRKVKPGFCKYRPFQIFILSKY